MSNAAETIHNATGRAAAILAPDGQVVCQCGPTEGQYASAALTHGGELRLYGADLAPETLALAACLAERADCPPLPETVPAGQGNQVLLSIQCAPSLESESLLTAFAGAAQVQKGEADEYIVTVGLQQTEYGEVMEICACLLEDAANGLSTPFRIGVSGVYSAPEQAGDALRQARTARAGGAPIRMGEYKDCLLPGAAAHLPAGALAYLTGLIGIKGMEEFLRPDFARIFLAFLSKNLNISDTAREAYIHRNSLKYKLDKLYRISGLDLRKVNDAVVFNLLLTVAQSGEI